MDTLNTPLEMPTVVRVFQSGCGESSCTATYLLACWYSRIASAAPEGGTQATLFKPVEPLQIPTCAVCPFPLRILLFLVLSTCTRYLYVDSIIQSSVVAVSHTTPTRTFTDTFLFELDTSPPLRLFCFLEHRSFDESVRDEPLVYRLVEAVLHYGEVRKAVNAVWVCHNDQGGHVDYVNTRLFL